MEIEIIKEFEDPVNKNKIQFAIIPIELFEVIEHQRKASLPHVKRLVKSLKIVGFISTVVAVKRENKFVIIDGQHRFLAAKELNARFLPALIVPEELSHYLIELNAEKSLTIREKAYVALQIYNRFREEEGSLSEDSEIIQDSIEGEVYLVTLGMAYELNPRFLGSAFKSIIRRCDSFFQLPLLKASENRKKRAERLLEMNGKVRKIVSKIKESTGLVNPFLYQSVISVANPIEHKKVVNEDFESIIDKLSCRLDDLIKDPSEVIKHYQNNFSV